jgi:uncharacterized protein YdiU (UPF0061 family)
MKSLKVVNWFDKELAPDPNEENITRQTSGVTHSYVAPLKFPNAQLLHVSDFYKELGLNQDDINAHDFESKMTGQSFLKDTKPYAMAYSGHQFGQWAGQLGDGRAINLFEALYKEQPYMFQLKGAGPTPYSRQGDGMAVLRSSIREHLCSEAMHHLGVPTTRSLSLSISGIEVLRDKLYDGNAAYELGAIVCRVAPTFVRFGNFEHFAAQRDDDRLKALADYTMNHHYTEINFTASDKYLQLFSAVCDRTLEMVLNWQRVGFVHGVMNTDNMSILGLTIDYGPYGWLEPYDHQWTPNTTDRGLRYAYANQPEIGLWNLLQLANALFPLINDATALEERLMEYKTSYYDKYQKMMMDKLGLESEQTDDKKLTSSLTALLQLHETDMTIFFRELSKVTWNVTTSQNLEILHPAFYNLGQMSQEIHLKWEEWIAGYTDRIKNESVGVVDVYAFAKARSQKMNSINPKYVLRNYMAQLVIDDAEKGDYELLNEVYTLLKTPYDDQPAMEKWYAPRPEWPRSKVGCSVLSCSS